MSEDQTPESFPLFGEEKENLPPSADRVLRYLSQTLSVTKTLKRFPSLSPKYLQEILLHSADRLKEGPQPSPSSFPPGEAKPSPAEHGRKEFPEFFIHTDGASRGNPGEAGAGAVISDDMDMKAISAEYDRETALELALNAGSDIILIANNLAYDEGIAARAQEIILGLVAAGRVSRARIDQACRRVLELKGRGGAA